MKEASTRTRTPKRKNLPPQLINQIQKNISANFARKSWQAIITWKDTYPHFTWKWTSCHVRFATVSSRTLEI